MKPSLYACLTILMMFFLAAATPGASPTATPTPEAAPPTPVPTAPLPPIHPGPIESTLLIEYHYSTFNMRNEVMMTPEWYQTQLDWLAENGFQTVTANQLVRFLEGRANLPPRPVVLTFDLGTAHYDDYAEVIIPALRRHNFHAIFFVLASEGVVSDTCRLRNLFCWDDLRGWAEEGLISIGSHGISHPDYTKIEPDEIRFDMQRSKEILEEKTGQPVIAFAYPYDSVPKDAEKLAKEAGYRFAAAGWRNDFTIQAGDADRFRLPRLYPYSNQELYPVLTAFKRQGYSFPRAILRMLVPEIEWVRWLE